MTEETVFGEIPIQGPVAPTVKRKAGRPRGSKGKKPKFEPTEEQRHLVNMMSTSGVKQVDQAKALGIHEHTLRKFFRQELDHGKVVCTSHVVGALYNNAVVKGNVTAQIFWLKSQAGWREADRLELTGANGKSLENLTDTDKEQRIMNAMMKAKGILPRNIEPIEVANVDSGIHPINPSTVPAG
jgi:hypothetical protein